MVGDATDPTLAKKVRVALGATTTRNVTLGPGVSISGLVSVGTTALPSATIDAYTAVSGNPVGYSSDLQCDGHFTISGLAPGSYKLAIRTFDGTEHRTWYGGSDQASAALVTVTTSGATVTWNLP
jgi:hypothetical protein